MKIKQAINLPKTAECPHQNGTPFGGGMNASARVIAPAHGMRCVASSRLALCMNEQTTSLLNQCFICVFLDKTMLS
jgi:hypothetical protein